MWMAGSRLKAVLPCRLAIHGLHGGGILLGLGLLVGYAYMAF